MSEHHQAGQNHPSHNHAAGSTRTRLGIALAITASILVVEVIGAMITGSLALLVDAVHMLTDVGGLTIALIAATLSLKPPTARRTWGYLRSEVLAALAQSAILLAVGLYAIIEGVTRLIDPPEVRPQWLLVFGIVGLLGNIASILVLVSGRNANLNLRAAFLEVVNDALGSVAVIIGAIVIATTGWARADAVAGLVIAALILPRAITILREATSVLLENTPPGLDLDDVRAHILELDHVLGVHDLHASRVSTGLPIITAHVVIEAECFTDSHAPEMLDALQHCVGEHFPVSVEHSTFQLEPPQHAEHEHPHH